MYILFNKIQELQKVKDLIPDIDIGLYIKNNTS